jgi:type II secretory pathway predicted ATPase ExeA
MSSIESPSNQALPFDGLPEPRFFYRNLSNLEVLAALRFGVEARKGLILLTGDAGSGKSAVLSELACELNSKAVCILLTDPHVRFIELLPLILHAVGGAAEDDNEAALILSCQSALRLQLESNRIVALAFDDAQDLPAEVIESLTSHFLGKGFDPDNNLLQIVLAGRPELRKRLLTPPLCALGTQVEIECRLKPLDVKDIGLYINHRLWAADLPLEIFEHDAIERIALYSDGRPGAVNAICDRALQLAYPSPSGKIKCDAIAKAARDLKLYKSGRSGKKTPHRQAASFEPLDETSASSATAVAFQTFFNFNDADDRKRWWWPVKRNGWAISLFLIFVLGVLWAARGDKRDAIFGSPQHIPAQEAVDVEGAPPALSQDPISASLPSSDVPPQSSAVPKSGKPVGAQTPPSVEPSPAPPGGAPADNLASSTARSQQDRAEFSRKAPGERGVDQAKQVAKAIANRAILGVHVSVVEGIVYLDGKVATQEQKNAAELAARGVSEAGAIQNRIAVE